MMATQQNSGRVVGRVQSLVWSLAKILFKRKIETNYMEKLLPRCEYGLFLGVKRASGELIIMSLDGVKIVRSARRVPVEDRWDVKASEWVKLVPWNLGRKRQHG